MLETIIGALLPTAFTILLGYLAARHHLFGPADSSSFNRLVMTYALPMSIFVGMVGTTREALSQDLVLAITLLAAILGTYGIVYLLCRHVFRLSVGVSALGALGASFPNTLFMGLPVLTYLYREAGVVPATLGSIIPQTTVVPLTVFLLSLEKGSKVAGAARAGTGQILRNLLHTLSQPLVWGALLGVILVLVGVRVPPVIADSLAVLGRATSGVALFSSGLILAGYAVSLSGPVTLTVLIKNVAQPALVLACLSLLGYSRPLLGEAVVTTAMPTVAILPMLAAQYQVGVKESASVLLLSTIGSLITLAAFIALTN
jgi:malonate transporter and related proteins